MGGRGRVEEEEGIRSKKKKSVGRCRKEEHKHKGGSRRVEEVEGITEGKGRRVWGRGKSNRSMKEEEEEVSNIR